MPYQERMKALRAKKIADTKAKMTQQGYMDAYDYGTVPLPEGYHFEPTKKDGGIFGPAACIENYERFMENHPIYVDPLEILAGRWRDRFDKYREDFPWPDSFSYDHMKPLQELYDTNPGIAKWAHFAADYSIGMRLGWGGLLQKVRRYRALNRDPEKEVFYDAEERTVLAIQGFIARHIPEIERLLASETRPEIQATLRDMLEANKNIIDKPPATFLEACQWMAWFATVSRMYNRDGAGCQLDVMLLPYYERDKKAGILDDEKAKFIIANLLLVDTHYYQLSGPDVEGNDMTSPLSYLILEAGRMLDASCNLTVRWHENMDEAFFRKAVETIFEDRRGWPRFSGDLGLMNYTKNKGITKEIARSRYAVGCHWMSVPGREYSLNDTIKINVAKLFMVAFDEMMAAEGEKSMDELTRLIRKHMEIAVDTIAKGLLFHMEHQHKVFPELVMNLMMQGTIERGENISQCAELFTFGIDGAGLGTVADSMAAIEARVVNEKKLTFDELNAWLQNDFEGVMGERIRLMLASSPRYCGGNTLGDKWAKWLSVTWADVIKSYPMPEPAQIIPGWFSWSRTIQFGQTVGATPNGRHRGAPITHGANPTPGFRKDGAVTAMATGIAAIQPGYGDPAPLQLEFDPRLSAEEGGIDRVAEVIKTHFRMGGTLININVLDKEVLMEAHRDPMSHPDLVVRVTGFTAYFCALSPEFRQLVIDRFIDGM